MNTEWSEERIKEGFERFIRDNGRLPTAFEVDGCPYLPSSRWIQMRFGGLKKLRAALGYEDTDFTSGSLRAQISTRITKRGLQVEWDIEKHLMRHFGEVYVHTEKRYGRKRQRVDFFVFSPDGNLGVEVFFPATLRDVQPNVRAHVDRYLDFPDNVHLFFVVANDGISQEEVDSVCTNISKLKRIPLLKVTSLRAFYEVVSQMRRFDDPPNYQPVAVV
jgi:hypothetical protein